MPEASILSRISLLLIGDHATFSANIAFFLKYRPQLKMVATAIDLVEGVNHAQALHPDITLIDLELDDFTGLEAIHHLRAVFPEMGIIALSFVDQEDYREAVLAAGADDFVSKTHLTEDLLAAVQHVRQARHTL